MVQKILLTTWNNFKNPKLFFFDDWRGGWCAKFCWQQQIISKIPNWFYDGDWRRGWCAKSCWQQEIISKIPNWSYDGDWRGGWCGKSCFLLFLKNILLMSTSRKIDEKNLRQALLFVWVRKPNPAQLQKILKNPFLRLILIRLRIWSLIR